MIRRAGAVALALAASLVPGSLSATAARAPVSQCRAGEEVVYSCRFGKAVGSVCAGARQVTYRFGPLGKPALALTNRADWSNVRLGHVIGQGSGGFQEHVRFTNGQTHYVVYRGRDGALADRPGRTYSGIAVQHGESGARNLARLNCNGSAQIAGSMTEAVQQRAPQGQDLAEAADGPFDGWF